MTKNTLELALLNVSHCKLSSLMSICDHKVTERFHLNWEKCFFAHPTNQDFCRNLGGGSGNTSSSLKNKVKFYTVYIGINLLSYGSFCLVVGLSIGLFLLS